MLEIKEINKVLSSYGLKSNKYGPTIYQVNDTTGLCLEIKDPTFGYLTRVITFTTLEELDDFLSKYTWYKNNLTKYELTLEFDNYETLFPKIKFKYQNTELSFKDMLNLPNTIEENKEAIEEDNTTEIYLANIENITNYLINLKNQNFQNKQNKNNLKIQENDLKFTLLEALTEYYGKTRTIEKKGVSLESLAPPTADINTLKNNLINIRNKTLEEKKGYLEALINITKDEELDEKNLVNIYSNSIYQYNISILNKQIEFVRSKINAEKNFNLKGSKIHNIDEELKSFLKTNNNPPKIEDFINNTKSKILAKYQSITLEDAYTKISGQKLNFNIKEIPQIKIPDADPLKELKTAFLSLNTTDQASLILYTSLYKKIINKLILTNYDLNAIKNDFDWSYYFEEIDEIVHNTENNHYLNTYFQIINFKNLDTFLASLVNIAQTINTFSLKTTKKITLFTLNNNDLYQELSKNAIFENNSFILNINPDTDVIYIPYKLQIDTEEDEITLIETDTFYYKGKISATDESLIVNKYTKAPINNKEEIITEDLTLSSTTNFKIGVLEGETNG